MNPRIVVAALGLMLSAADRPTYAQGARAAPANLWAYCSVRDSKGMIAYRSPVFLVRASAYDAPPGSWMDTILSASFRETLPLVAALGGAIDGCFAREASTSATAVKDGVSPDRVAFLNDVGFRVVEDVREKEAYALDSKSRVVDVDWRPDAALLARARQAATRWRQEHANDAASSDGFLVCRLASLRGTGARLYFSDPVPVPKGLSAAQLRDLRHNLYRGLKAAAESRFGDDAAVEVSYRTSTDNACRRFATRREAARFPDISPADDVYRDTMDMIVRLGWSPPPGTYSGTPTTTKGAQ